MCLCVVFTFSTWCLPTDNVILRSAAFLIICDCICCDSCVYICTLRSSSSSRHGSYTPTNAVIYHLNVDAQCSRVQQLTNDSMGSMAWFECCVDIVPFLCGYWPIWIWEMLSSAEIHKMIRKNVDRTKWRKQQKSQRDETRKKNQDKMWNYSIQCCDDGAAAAGSNNKSARRKRYGSAFQKVSTIEADTLPTIG